ncbi:hypothetical protein [Enterovirga aerilata]|uniref:Uncharacterized protein n=1 Tax=Enterovirga aerilata TaxID=2730920 RepID=A0A849IEZ5_9HYPH|nr:hypothetical protein [Enterovirga sp. DB1703]NNM75019.1 hypothetical protein [Enterovirga sp. DB1703]
MSAHLSAFDAALDAISRIPEPREPARVPGAHYSMHVAAWLCRESKRLERIIAITPSGPECSRLIDQKIAVDMRESAELRRAQGRMSPRDAALADLGRAMADRRAA